MGPVTEAIDTAATPIRPHQTEDTIMIRFLFRRTLLVATLAVAAQTAFHGSAGAYPGPDHDGDYSAPYWIYANPAAVSRQVADGPTPEPWFEAAGR
jgi:hypothetical protein